MLSRTLSCSNTTHPLEQTSHTRTRQHAPFQTQGANVLSRTLSCSNTTHPLGHHHRHDPVHSAPLNNPTITELAASAATQQLLRPQHHSTGRSRPHISTSVHTPAATPPRPMLLLLPKALKSLKEFHHSPPTPSVEQHTDICVTVPPTSCWCGTNVHESHAVAPLSLNSLSPSPGVVHACTHMPAGDHTQHGNRATPHSCQKPEAHSLTCSKESHPDTTRCLSTTHYAASPTPTLSPQPSGPAPSSSYKECV